MKHIYTALCSLALFYLTVAVMAACGVTAITSPLTPGLILIGVCGLGSVIGNKIS